MIAVTITPHLRYRDPRICGSRDITQRKGLCFAHPGTLPASLAPASLKAGSVPAGVAASGFRSKGMAVKKKRGILSLSLSPFFFCLRQRRQFLSICPKKGRELNLFLQGCQQAASIRSQGQVAEAVGGRSRTRQRTTSRAARIQDRLGECLCPPTAASRGQLEQTRDVAGRGGHTQMERQQRTMPTSLPSSLSASGPRWVLLGQLQSLRVTDTRHLMGSQMLEEGKGFLPGSYQGSKDLVVLITHIHIGV